MKERLLLKTTKDEGEDAMIEMGEIAKETKSRIC